MGLFRGSGGWKLAAGAALGALAGAGGLAAPAATQAQATPIRHIHVTRAGEFGSVRMDADRHGVDALGGTLPARELGAGLLRRLEECRHLKRLAPAKLEALKPDDVNALEGKDVAFQFGETKIPFVAETFLLSFSLPNFHFHATTAYDILRSRGVPIGKRDYMGRLRIKK